MCWPESDRERFRLVVDSLNGIFAWDDLIDESTIKLDPEGAKRAVEDVMSSLRDPEHVKTEFVQSDLLRDFWLRSLPLTTPGCQKRFLDTMDGYTHSTYEQVIHRAKDFDLDIDEFIIWRRQSSAVRVVFVLIELGLGLDMPDEVMEHPLILRLDECANDLIGLGNDLYSFNREQSAGQYTNLVPVAMNKLNLTLQNAIDFVDQLLHRALSDFLTAKAALPSWGPEIDERVEAYVRGMQHWVARSIKWGYESKRYFTDEEFEEFKMTGCLKVWEKKKVNEVGVAV